MLKKTSINVAVQLVSVSILALLKRVPIGIEGSPGCLQIGSFQLRIGSSFVLDELILDAAEDICVLAGVGLIPGTLQVVHVEIGHHSGVGALEVVQTQVGQDRTDVAVVDVNDDARIERGASLLEFSMWRNLQSLFVAKESLVSIGNGCHKNEHAS